MLAAFSLYAMMGYNVARRTNEIGLRLALGASRRRVLRLVLGDATVTTAVGVAVGSLAAMALGRIVQGLLHGVKGTDPLVTAGAVGVLCGVMILAVYLPARRAANLDPARALRVE